MSSRNLLYAFVSDGEVKYIGKTVKALKTRVNQYQNPDPTQSTNIKNNDNIAKLLKAGEAVDVFALVDNGLMQYGGFHINLAAGLEDSLISTLTPPWNGSQRVVPTKTETEPDKANGAKFEVTLGKTYYEKGFFNVPVPYGDHFGTDREEIDIFCGQLDQSVTGYINRKTNASGSPRIFGGTGLRDWFWSNFQLGDVIEVEVKSPQEVVVSAVGRSASTDEHPDLSLEA
jgi:hypothetical protein